MVNNVEDFSSLLSLLVTARVTESWQAKQTSLFMKSDNNWPFSITPAATVIWVYAEHAVKLLVNPSPEAHPPISAWAADHGRHISDEPHGTSQTSNTFLPFITQVSYRPDLLWNSRYKVLFGLKRFRSYSNVSTHGEIWVEQVFQTAEFDNALCCSDIPIKPVLSEFGVDHTL